MTEPTTPQPNVMQIQVIALAVAFSNVVYAIVLVLLSKFSMPENGFLGEDAWPLDALAPLFLMLAVALVIVSFFVRRMMLPRVRGDLAAKLRLTLIGMALADCAGVLGLLLCFTTGSLTWGLVLCAVGLAGAILHFPTRFWLEEDA